MIVNKDHLEVKFLNRLENLLPKNKLFYIFNCNKINFAPIILKANDLLAANINILIDCSQEGFYSIVNKIYTSLIVSNKIQEDKIFLLSGAADIQQIVEFESKKFNKKPFQSYYINELEIGTASQLNSFIKTETFEKINFLKSFICLNRHWRLHRPLLVAMLAKRNLINKGFVSLTDSFNMNWDDIIHTIKLRHSKDNEIYNFFLKNKEYIKTLTPLVLDESKLNQPQFSLTHNLNYFYENSYFSVVTETYFYSNVKAKETSMRFLTEKTFKPIVYKHSFILVSVPNMLPLLRDAGYKTFHPYIDESYDSEVDDGKRMIKILDEIERLSNLKEEELTDFLQNVAPICEHNFNLLYSKKDL
jgi:hypothetical protein